jgi:hypothetical protein
MFGRPQSRFNLLGVLATMVAALTGANGMPIPVCRTPSPFLALTAMRAPASQRPAQRSALASRFRGLLLAYLRCRPVTRLAGIPLS